jgi:maltose/moltooligosaccharide transporter
MAMEPYRAFVGDKLPDEQMSFGYQMQSLFVGAGIVLANASIFLFQDWFGGAAEVTETSTAIPRWLYYSFFIGALLSVSTILWSVLKTPEIPPSDEEMEEMKRHNEKSLIDRINAPFKEIVEAIKDMPNFMWKLSWVYLFQWYALFVYWQFVAPLFVEQGYDQSQALSQAAKMNTTYNISTMVIALALVPLAVKFGSRKVYTGSLFLTGIAMISIPYIHDPMLVLFPMVLFGIGWAAMMGIPYSMVSKIVPQDRRGVYMGILNMMIVIPMGIQTLTFGPIVKNLLGNSAINAILLAGVFFILSGLLSFRLKEPESTGADAPMAMGGGH